MLINLATMVQTARKLTELLMLESLVLKITISSIPLLLSCHRCLVFSM